MNIYLHEISENVTHLSWTDENSWLLKTICALDELEPTNIQLPHAPPTHTKLTPRKISLAISHQRLENTYLLRGKIDTTIQQLCSRCATPFQFLCQFEFMETFEYHPQGIPLEEETACEKADITFLTKDFIDLEAIVTEQIQLQLPIRPLCKETCKGMCFRCGANFNYGRCACDKLTTHSSPFAALKLKNGKL